MKSIPDGPYLDETRLCDITPDHVRRLTSIAISHGYSPQTVKHIKNAISAIISHARKERVFSGDNLITEVHLPPIARKGIPSISLLQAKTIFGMMEYPERQIALVMFNSSMNVSEVCGLHWSYINLSLTASYIEGNVVPPRSILVRYRRTSSGLMRLCPEHIRLIEISSPLLDLLNSLRRQKNRRNSNNFRFANQLGTPISPASILVSKLKPISRRVGIPFSWHTLKEVHDVLLQDLRTKLNSDLAAL